MTRQRILRSPAYWISKIQIALYNCAEKFMADNSMNRTQLAQHLGVSKGYISQLLNGDYDHKLSKLVELSLSFGFVPKIEFQPISGVMKEEPSAYASMSISGKNIVSASTSFTASAHCGATSVRISDEKTDFTCNIFINGRVSA